MMKILSKFSVIHLAIIFSSFFLGILLRFYSLDIQVPWTDELASLYFAKKLDHVFSGESHTPFYYGVLRVFLTDSITIFSARMFSGILSIFYLILFFIFGRRVVKGNSFILFWILICLSPVDIVFARQARHYAWMGEHVLLFALMIKAQVGVKALSANALLSGFIHPFAAIPTVLLSLFDYREKKDKRKLLILLISSSLFLLYYLARLFLYGTSHVGSNLSWNYFSHLDFLKSLALIFFGDAYPRNEFFPIPDFSWILGILSLVIFFIYQRSRAVGEWLIVLGCSVLAVEFLSLIWVNFRTARYLIYLPFLLYFTIAFSVKKVSDKVLVSLFFIHIFYLAHISITSIHPWDDGPVETYKILKEQNPEASELICSNIYQADYYGFNKKRLCSYQPISLEVKKPILFMDFNGDSQILILTLMDLMNPVYHQRFPKGQIILFRPK